MNRITKRTWIVGLFLGVLLCGLLLFVGEYVTDAEAWVSFSGSPHLYNSSNIGCGTITDRSGQTLLSIAQGEPTPTMPRPGSLPFTGWATGTALLTPRRFPLMPAPWQATTGSTACTMPLAREALPADALCQGAECRPGGHGQPKGNRGGV